MQGDLDTSTFTRTLKVAAIVLVVLASLPACPGGRTSRTDGGSSGSCPDISGTWIIASHCEASAIGGMVMVTQTGCAIESSGTFPPGWGGSVDAAGGITMSGPAGEQTLTCTGSVEGESMSMSCTPGGCAVRLTR